MYRSLLAAALVPLALGDYSYDYSVPTMAPTTETAPPTLEVCPQLAGLTEEDCPGGEINDTLAACNSTGLVLGQFCWAIVDGTPGAVPTCGDEPDTDCAYTGPPFDIVHRRVGLVPAGARGGQVGRRPVAARHLGLLDAGPGTSPFPFLPTPAPSRPRPDPLPPRPSRPVSRAPNSRSLPTCLFPGAGRRRVRSRLSAARGGTGDRQAPWRRGGASTAP